MMVKPETPIKDRDISSEWLQLLFDSALDGIVSMDAVGRIIAFNPAAEKIFGYKKEGIIGRMVSDMLIPPNLRQAHEKGLARLLSGGEKKMLGQRVKVVAMRADGSTFPAEIDIVSMNPERTPVFCAYIRDISEQEQFAEERQQNIKRTNKILLQTILAFSKSVEIRDPYTSGHQQRVAHLAASIAKEMGLSDKQTEGIFLGALIHDIGKIAVPAEILSRPGKLQHEDCEYIHIHCHRGYEILKAVDFPWPIAKIALQHHEHLDGSGYPQGLRSQKIFLEARIVCVADVVEALTAHRPYRPAYPLGSALQLLVNNTPQWYEPKAVTACLTLFDAGYKIADISIEEISGFANSL